MGLITSIDINLYSGMEISTSGIQDIFNKDQGSERIMQLCRCHIEQLPKMSFMHPEAYKTLCESQEIKELVDGK